MTERAYPPAWDQYVLKPADVADSPDDDGPLAGRGVVELSELLARDDPPYDWVVPNLIERTDRVILTGGEGGGKSTFLRQTGVKLAAGIHPFTDEPIDPVRVFMLDLENSERQSRRKFNALYLVAGDRYKPFPGLHIRCVPEGINLMGDGVGAQVLDLVREVKPDVLITGPLYKLADGDPTEERPAKAVATWLDRIRVDVGCALLIEAHTPHAANGGKRPERPYGASLWLRWPEFGLYLSPEGHLRHWRGARDEREWPVALRRGGDWPWTVANRERDILWARIADLCRQAGDQLSRRDLAQLTGASVSTVGRAIEEHAAEWQALGEELSK